MVETEYEIDCNVIIIIIIVYRSCHFSLFALYFQAHVLIIKIMIFLSMNFNMEV